jgi:hypothetical protein
MIKLTTKIVKSIDLWSKINPCTKSLLLRKINTVKKGVSFRHAGRWDSCAAVRGDLTRLRVIGNKIIDTHACG